MAPPNNQKNTLHFRNIVLNFSLPPRKVKSLRIQLCNNAFRLFKLVFASFGHNSSTSSSYEYLLLPTWLTLATSNAWSLPKYINDKKICSGAFTLLLRREQTPFLAAVSKFMIKVFLSSLLWNGVYTFRFRRSKASNHYNQHNRHNRRSMVILFCWPRSSHLFRVLIIVAVALAAVI